MRGFKVAYRINGELVSPTEDQLNTLMLLFADGLVLLAPDSQSHEAALLVPDQVARKWAMSVNYDKTIGVVVTPPTAATQGDQPCGNPGPLRAHGPSKIHFQPRGLKLQTALLQLLGALTPHIRGSRVMGPHGFPGCLIGGLPQFRQAPHDGPLPRHGGPHHSEAAKCDRADAHLPNTQAATGSGG